MKRDPIILVIATAFVVLIFVTAAIGWSYLMRGYSLAVGISGEKPKLYHVDFPFERGVVHIIFWSAALVVVALFAIGWTSARRLGWAILAAGLAIAAWDVVQYGTIGSPTSVWALLLLLAIAFAAQLRGRIAKR